MGDYSNFGKRPAGADKEQIRIFMRDTIIEKSTGFLTEKTLFDPSEAKSKELRSDVLPLPKGRIVEITHARVSYNMKFKSLAHQQLFEEYAHLHLSVEDKDYGDIPLSLLLAHNRVAIAGADVASASTTSHNQFCFGKEGTFAQLPNPIRVPENGKIEILFKPGTKGLEYADAATDGVKFGANVVDAADTSCWWIRVDFMGVLLRDA